MSKNSHPESRARKNVRAGDRDSGEVPNPTPGELEILQVLWQRGPSTVRSVQESLSGRTVGYTTVLKMLQLMHSKGLVERDERRRSHVYRATLQREEAENRLVGDLMARAFQGSASRLVLQALQAKPASRREIEEIRRFLDRIEEDDS